MPTKRLDELDMSIALEGCEGLNVNYASNIRAQYMFVQHQSMIKQMQFADAKAAAIITLVGLLTLRGPVQLAELTSTGVFGYLFMSSAGLSIIFAILAVFPRYPSKQQRKQLALSDRWSWPALTCDTFNADEFSNYIRTAEISQLLHSIAISNSSVAHILLSKYKMLRLGFIFGFLSILLAGIEIADII